MMIDRKFSKGDLVRCCHNGGYDALKIGEVYTIDCVDYGDKRVDVWLVELPGRSFYNGMFEAVR